MVGVLVLMEVAMIVMAMEQSMNLKIRTCEYNLAGKLTNSVRPVTPYFIFLLSFQW
jgi:hypothetical protein